MSPAAEHNEWLGLVPTSGPFLSVPVLLRAFPQGLDARDPALTAELRLAYAEWHDAPGNPVMHRAWTRWVLTRLLGFPEDLLAEGQALPPGLEAAFPEHGETLRPTLAILPPGDGPRHPALLVQVLPTGQGLEKPLAGAMWKATPAARMGDLLRVTDFPLGLVTNGEQWTLVSRVGENTGRADWFADVWLQEPLTLRAFTSLLGVGRTFGQAEDQRLPALLRASEGEQQEVTGRLGAQVREAVAVLIQAFDRLDADSGRTLLAGVEEKTLYEAALAVMMRLVFLFSAEERGLLLLGDPLYDQHYAISPLGAQLRERADLQGEEVLERFADAWCRLLTVFRAVHGGILHERLRLPAYGGTLFDPDRFPFLEGRPAGTRWLETPARPLRVDNRVVLHLLEALQFLQVKIPGSAEKIRRRLSFQSLDIEQIGHVYERLLDHTARRAGGVVLGLLGTGGRDPDARLEHLETLRAEGGERALLEELTDKTGRSESALRNALLGPSAAGSRPGRRKPATPALLMETAPAYAPELFPPAVVDGRLLAACGHDPTLAARVTPFAGLLREDTFGRPAVVLPGSLHVTAGTDRKLTGTHYTPRALTEPIVKHTLEPLVFHGPAEGLPREEWRIKTPREILALKVCDLAMGSGAFLVEACRFLGLHLVRAWETVERDARPGAFVTTPEGDLATGDPAERLLPADPAERLAIARRCVADRCLYGVDINPMAVDIAKLSLWLVTLQRDWPFTFLDHALKFGDSLLGVSRLEQLTNFSLRLGPVQDTFATSNLFRYVQHAADKRHALRKLLSDNPGHIAEKTLLHGEAEAATAKVKALADCLVALELRQLQGEAHEMARTIAADAAELAMRGTTSEFQAYARKTISDRPTFHWPMEFPEVFEGERSGFDAFLGNPPYMGGTLASETLGADYMSLLQYLSPPWHGKADYTVGFFKRTAYLSDFGSKVSLITTSSLLRGESLDSGLRGLVAAGWQIYAGRSSYKWPGTANVEVINVSLSKDWKGRFVLNESVVNGITEELSPGAPDGIAPVELPDRYIIAFLGAKLCPANREIPYTTYRQAQLLSPELDEFFVPTLGGQELYELVDHDLAPRSVLYSKLDAFVSAGKIPPTNPLISVGSPTNYIHSAPSLALTRLLATSPLAFACGETSTIIRFVRVPTEGIILKHKLVVFPAHAWATFGIIQSDIHTLWCWRWGLRRKSDFVYSPKRCASTFPLPDGSVTQLNTLAEIYHSQRGAFMAVRQEGLTKTYNRFHKPSEIAPDICTLRELHSKMTCAVAFAYGWTDITLDHDFHSTEQGVRFTLSESARREVLDRLLLLNHQRYKEEVAAGLHEKGGKKKPKTSPRSSPTASPAPAPQAAFDFTSPRPQPVISPATDDELADKLAFGTAISLYYAILSEAGGSLLLREFRRAFGLAASPDRLKIAAKAADQPLVAEWLQDFPARLRPDVLKTVLSSLGSGNVVLTEGPGGLIVSLTPGWVGVEDLFPQAVQIAPVVLRAVRTVAITEPALTEVDFSVAFTDTEARSFRLTAPVAS